MSSTALLDTYALDSHAIDWVPAGPGLSFKPLAFRPDNAGWVQLLRLDPGTVIPVIATPERCMPSTLRATE